MFNVVSAHVFTRGAAMLELQLAETKKLVEELEAKLANQNIEMEVQKHLSLRITGDVDRVGLLIGSPYGVVILIDFPRWSLF